MLSGENTVVNETGFLKWLKKGKREENVKY